MTEVLLEVAAVHTDGRLARIVRDTSAAGLLSPPDGARPRDALELGTRPVGEIAVPVARMVTEDHRITPAEPARAAARARCSRLPVTGEPGTVLGSVTTEDVLEGPVGPATV
ncbi:hypothetical protein ACFYOG_24990 [Streptomyces sp. NPDC007818]|uniref:hypothetical protein n=1 Tax=Streptomyces sp. NPDC007818 TaxID=3364780 RepID=UPI00369FB6EA